MVIPSRRRCRSVAVGLIATSALAATPALAQEDATIEAILERLERLERTQREQAADIEARDRRIAELEAQLALDDIAERLRQLVD